MIVQWQGRTWGAYDSNTLITEIRGLEDISRRAQSLSGGIDGEVAAPSFSDAGAFTVRMEVFAGSDAEMDATLADIKQATWGNQDRTAEDPFDYTMSGQTECTLFSRVTSRSVPTNLTTSERYRAVELILGFSCSDPTTYGAEVETELDPGDELTIGVGAWAPSERWRWIAHGAVGLPRLTLETDGYDDQILRVNHAVSGGQNVLVESTPHSLTHTVGGVSHLDWMDGGTEGTLPQFFKLLPGQTLRYTTTSGTGTALFRYRPAKP